MIAAYSDLDVMLTVAFPGRRPGLHLFYPLRGGRAANALTNGRPEGLNIRSLGHRPRSARRPLCPLMVALAFPGRCPGLRLFCPSGASERRTRLPIVARRDLIFVAWGIAPGRRRPLCPLMVALEFPRRCPGLHLFCPSGASERRTRLPIVAPEGLNIRSLGHHPRSARRPLCPLMAALEFPRRCPGLRLF